MSQIFHSQTLCLGTSLMAGEREPRRRSGSSMLCSLQLQSHRWEDIVGTKRWVSIDGGYPKLDGRGFIMIWYDLYHWESWRILLKLYIKWMIYVESKPGHARAQLWDRAGICFGQEGEPGAQIHLGAAEGEDASPLCERCDESGSKGRRLRRAEEDHLISSQIIQDPSMWNGITLI